MKIAAYVDLKSPSVPLCQRRKSQGYEVEKKFSTDNAAMIGILAERKLIGNTTTALDADIQPSWRL